MFQASVSKSKCEDVIFLSKFPTRVKSGQISILGLIMQASMFLCLVAGTGGGKLEWTGHCTNL